jgi:Ca-activated chloride channel family protein
MVPTAEILVLIRRTLDEWMRLRWSDLRFAETPTALLILGVLAAVALLALLARGLWRGQPGRTQLALPAVLPVLRPSALAATRHGAFLVFLLGVPFFAIALADPRTTFVREEVSYPGRRIAILVDASNSMVLPFQSAKLKPQGAPTFFTAVAAADYFIKLRMDGPYRDLIALLQFGNYAYVVTPFTTDYENVQLSVRLIGDPVEWGRFPEYGTTITESIEQATELFKAFDFLNASGNLLLVFSDGMDDQGTLRGRSLADLLVEVRKYQIPIFFVRTFFQQRPGVLPQDDYWRSAVEKTGGRFYAASDEGALLDAMADINKLAPGRIDMREYSAQRPRFPGYALIAVGLWLAAAAMKLGIPHFRTFP